MSLDNNLTWIKASYKFVFELSCIETSQKNRKIGKKFPKYAVAVFLVFRVY